MVFDPYCFHCHGDTSAKANLNVDNYQTVVGMKDKIKSDVSSDQMPKGEALVPGDLKVIVSAWVDAGAPIDNIPMPDKPQPPPPPPPPGYDQVKDKIFEPYCSRCHAILLDPDQVKAKMTDIKNDVESGKMPKGGKPLSPKLKKLLEDWITAGTPMGFDEIKHTLFVPYCVRCHASFTDYNKTAKAAGEIQQQVESGNMPKFGGPLKPELKQLLNDWIKAGMPN